MNLELQADLFRSYPKLFRKPGTRLMSQDTADAKLGDGTAPIDERGVECGDGWFGIVDRLSRDCEKEIEAMDSRGVAKDRWPRIAQIKQKLGTLRFYVHGQLSGGLRDQIRLEHSDDGESAHTCERCGAPRNARGDTLLNTYCDNCAADLVAGRDDSIATSWEDFEHRQSQVLELMKSRRD